MIKVRHKLCLIPVFGHDTGKVHYFEKMWAVRWKNKYACETIFLKRHPPHSWYDHKKFGFEQVTNLYNSFYDNASFNEFRQTKENIGRLIFSIIFFSTMAVIPFIV